MVWPFILFELLLTLVAYLRWLRVAQREGWVPGRLIAAMQQATSASRRDGLHLLAVMLLSLVGVISVVVAFVAAALWLVWPRSLPLLDRQAPLVWDATTWRVAAVILVLHLILAGALLAVTLNAPLYALSLLPLAASSVAVLAVRMAGPRVAQA